MIAGRLLCWISSVCSALALMLCVVPHDAHASAAGVSGQTVVDHVFSDSFEEPLARFDDILLSPIVTADGTCPNTGSNMIDTRPGAPVRFCYRLENRSNVTLTQHEIVSSTYGVLFQGPLSMAPGTSVVIPDPGSPRVFQHRAIDLVFWRTSGAGRHGKENRTVRVNISPDIALYRFLTSNPADCQPGILPFFPAQRNSGYTALTVAPGASVTHCFRAKNTSTGSSATLTDNVLNDSGFGELLNTQQSFSNGQVFVVAANASASTSSDFDAQWTATDGTDAVSSMASSSFFVTPDPACDGIRQDTSFDYVIVIGDDFYILANVRLDFEVQASPATAGAATSFNAHGAITSLLPDGAFGPRRDTRIYLPIPDGIDLSRPFQAQASINGGTSISATLDAPGRMLVLSTGRVEGAPAEIDIQVNAFVDASRSAPIAWEAPRLELDIEGDTGAFTTNPISPDPTGPPVLETPICTGL